MKFVFTSRYKMFSLLYKHTHEQIFDVPKARRALPNISHHFPKVTEDHTISQRLDSGALVTTDTAAD